MKNIPNQKLNLPEYYNLSNLISLLKEVNEEKIRESLNEYHPSEIASFIQVLNSKERRKILKILKNDFNNQILIELDPIFLENISDEIDVNILTKAINELDSDESALIFRSLSLKKRETILSRIKKKNRILLEHNLSFPDNSAGKLMQSELVKISKGFNVGDVIDLIRASKNLPKIFYDVYVVDSKNTFYGSVSLCKIISSKREVNILDLLKKNQESVDYRLDQEDVADIFRKRNLTSLAVVDGDKRLLGIINIENIVDVIDDEAEEDLLKLAGAGKQNFYGATLKVTKARFTWLFFNLFAAFFASYIIKNFENTIANLAVLAALMPIVASMGGCSGTQSLTTAVRAIAMKQLTWSNSFRSISREMFIGLLNGLIFSSTAFLVTIFWFDDLTLSLVISFSLFINLIFGSIFGTSIPIILTRLGVDPAIASGTFVTMLTDIFGFFMFLTLATIYLV